MSWVPRPFAHSKEAPLEASAAAAAAAAAVDGGWDVAEGNAGGVKMYPCFLPAAACGAAGAAGAAAPLAAGAAAPLAAGRCV